MYYIRGPVSICRMFLSTTKYSSWGMSSWPDFFFNVILSWTSLLVWHRLVVLSDRGFTIRSDSLLSVNHLINWYCRYYPILSTSNFFSCTVIILNGFDVCSQHFLCGCFDIASALSSLTAAKGYSRLRSSSSWAQTFSSRLVIVIFVLFLRIAHVRIRISILGLQIVIVFLYAWPTSA